MIYQGVPALKIIVLPRIFQAAFLREFMTVENNPGQRKITFMHIKNHYVLYKNK